MKCSKYWSKKCSYDIVMASWCHHAVAKTINPIFEILRLFMG